LSPPLPRTLAGPLAALLLLAAGGAAADDLPTAPPEERETGDEPEHEPEHEPSAAPQEHEPAPARGPRWYAIPNFAFDTDDGLGFGARGELAFDLPGHEPYQSAWVLHLFLTTRGFHHHRLRYDRTGLGPGGRLRFTAHLAWRQWLNDGYWGLGNGTVRERRWLDRADTDEAAAKRYRYTLRQPFAHLTLRLRLAGPWLAFAALDGKISRIATYPGSLLAEEQPFGMAGGPSLTVAGGLLRDTRRPEITPRTGLFAELSGRWCFPLPGGAGAFGGPLLSLRGYRAVGPRVVLAGRLLAEALAGEIPFYELVHWGGLVPVAGFGGAETLRGLAFGRWRAPGKALANLEARVDLLSHGVFGRPLRWQLVPYLDAGAVFGGEPSPGAATPDFPLHPAGGLGIRAIYEEAFVGRVDTGFGLDPVRELDGSVTQEPTLGIYVVFDHMY